MSPAPQFELRPLTIPPSIDDATADDFVAMCAVRNEIYREIIGNDDEALLPGQLLPHYQPSPEETRLSWIVLSAGRVVGRVGVDIPHEAGSTTANWLIELLREVQGRGIGTALHETVERSAREHGRTVLQSWAEHPEAPGDRLSPPTGFGSIPHDHIARFYLAAGYALEQVERKSILDLTDADKTIARLLEEARTRSSGYRVVQWTLPTPPEFVDGYAWVKSRMSTDAPAAGLEFDEEVWDAARIARHDARFVDAGTTVLVTVAIHEKTGEVVAFNELATGAGPGAATQQHDTLVLKEHRGHKLGQLVKCAGIRRWRELFPDSTRILTWNAEENRPMLDINEAVGFAPASYIGAWKKTLMP